LYLRAPRRNAEGVTPCAFNHCNRTGVREWRPLLHGEIARRALDIANAIIEEIVARSTDDATLADGAAGHALVHAYSASVSPGHRTDDTASRELDRAIDAVASTEMTPSLYAGFLGVAWTAQLLSGAGMDSAADANEDIDAALLELVAVSPWSGEYDLISGLVGFGVYALERLPRPAASSMLEAIVDRLDELGERRNDGITWHTPVRFLPPHARESHPDGWYNLGLAHGVPGVIAFLAGVCAARVAAPKARPLLDGAVSWLLARGGPQSDEAAFGYCVDRSNGPEPSRHAWCYGDPGVATAVLLAARAISQAAWRDVALSVARRAALRPRPHTGVVDASLCHGAAGLAHLYNRLFQATGERDFAVEARYWIERTLEYRGVGGIAGYRRAEFDGTQIDDTGLLNGAAGIALALLAAASNVEPGWDRAFLLSLRPLT